MYGFQCIVLTFSASFVWALLFKLVMFHCMCLLVVVVVADAVAVIAFGDPFVF